jgi:hypothetical protein
LRGALLPPAAHGVRPNSPALLCSNKLLEKEAKSHEKDRKAAQERDQKKTLVCTKRVDFKSVRVVTRRAHRTGCHCQA